MTYRDMFELGDIRKIDKLNTIKTAAEVMPKVRKWAKNTSDHNIRRWQILAEARYNELKQE